MPGYLGDKNKMVVHYLSQMTKNCGVYFIEKADRRYFTPDTLENAKAEGFVPCQSCLLESWRN